MPLHIANLGSSFSAGPGIPPVLDRAAGRSGSNYAHLVAGRIGAKLTDLSVSGATLLNLLNEPQRCNGRLFGPQIDDMLRDVDVVLVLGGGNDLGYIGGLFEDTLSRSWIGSIVLGLKRCLSFSSGGAQGNDDEDLDVRDLEQRYGVVLDAVHTKAPQAKILVVEYLTMLGPDVRPGEDVVFGEDRIAHHKQVATRLLEATQLAVKERAPWCDIVQVAAVSESHAIGSREPWVAGFSWKLFRRGCAYHPRAEGMKAVSELVLTKLRDLGLIETST